MIFSKDIREKTKEELEKDVKFYEDTLKQFFRDCKKIKEEYELKRKQFQERK